MSNQVFFKTVTPSNLPPSSGPMRRRSDIYDALLRAQPDLAEGYCVLEEQRVVYVSPALSRLCGREPHEVETWPALVALLAPDVRLRVLAGYRARLGGLAPVSDRCETSLIHRNGSRIEVEATLRTIDAGAGRMQTIVLLRDITDRKRSETARAAALAENARLLIELRKAVRQQQAFLRDILRIVTEDRLHLCDTPEDLPAAPEMRAENEAASFELTTAVLKDLRRSVERAARAADLPDSRAFDLMMAASETAMNAVVHAGGGTARVCANPESGVVQVRVEDRGHGIELSHLHRATLERGFTTAGTLGQGFNLALRTCDRIYLLTGPSGTTVVLEQGRTELAPEW